MNEDKTTSDEADEQFTTPDEAINVDNSSPEERRAEYQEREGREVDATVPRPSEDGDEYDDTDDADEREP